MSRTIDADALITELQKDVDDYRGKDGYDGVILGLNIAIVEVKDAATTEKNEPLTMEELRYMDGAAVYMVYNGPGGPLDGWVLVEVDSEEDDVFWLTNSLGGRSEYTLDEGLEDGMMLYRYPPKEGI